MKLLVAIVAVLATTLGLTDCGSSGSAIPPATTSTATVGCSSFNGETLKAWVSNRRVGSTPRPLFC